MTLSARQIISVARGILSSADVLMLHKPVSFLTPKEADIVLGVLGQYAQCGGLWGMLDPKHAAQGTSATHYLTGNGVRTVILTMPHHARDVVPEVVTKIINCETACDTPEEAAAVGRTPSVEKLSSEDFTETQVSSHAAQTDSDLVFVHKRSAENDARENAPRSASRPDTKAGVGGTIRSLKTSSSVESLRKTITADEALKKLAADASVHRVSS